MVRGRVGAQCFLGAHTPGRHPGLSTPVFCFWGRLGVSDPQPPRALVSCGLRNASPQAWWLRVTPTYGLTVLAARSAAGGLVGPGPRRQPGYAPPPGPGTTRSLPLWPPGATALLRPWPVLSRNASAPAWTSAVTSPRLPPPPLGTLVTTLGPQGNPVQVPVSGS